MPTKNPLLKREKEQRKYLRRKENNPQYLQRKNARKEAKRKTDPLYQAKKNKAKYEKLKTQPERLKALNRRKYENTLDRKTDFLAYDGEGYNGKYVLLANSIDHIYNPDGLSTFQCLAFLSRRENTSHRIFFFFSYDINMICQDIPEQDLLLLFRGEKIQYGAYNLQYLARKIFIIRTKSRSYSYYDTGSFFMCSFIRALEKNGIEVPDLIKIGKEARGEFEQWSKEDLIEYNRIECILLEGLLSKLKEAFQLEVLGTTLEPKGYYGPGAVANVLLSALQVRKYTTTEQMIPDEIKTILPFAFFGGRIEALKLGYFNQPIYSYDIRSAYPYQFSLLPEISLRWIYVKSPTIVDVIENPFSLWLVEWQVRGDTCKMPGLLPYRDKNGFIYFPANGKGWYYGVEIASVLLSYPSDFVKIHRGYIMHDRGNRPFKDNFEYLYNYRQELKANNDPRELALKLSYNSVYGKLIQNVGSSRFRSLLYAGLITAQTRAQLLLAVKDNLKDIVSFQTDGIKSLSPIKLGLGKNLGQWESDIYDNIQILGAGIYQCKDTEDNIIVKTTRGYNLRKFDFQEISTSVLVGGHSKIKTSLFIGNLSAILHKQAYGEYRNRFLDIDRTYNPMSLDIGSEEHKKRVFNFIGFPDFNNETYNSKMYQFPNTSHSYPYGVFAKDELQEEIDKAFFELELEGN